MVMYIDCGGDAPVASPQWVVISLLNVLTAMCFAVVGVVLGSSAVIVAAMVVGGSGSISINLLARAMQWCRRRRHPAGRRGTVG
ncbi:hypothetical protein [[Mycobacterium] nativiensis]|uniref:Transmembrane protein n=1 Tax=[Mycobacterium] nativiensis TaxID=2855503 RepID=A0ABU5XQ95_9MYCO|nr:hypothetical protein [Mycolicibacter sp. MYC340]MEB3030088.1 hypothetical protein [Mycolicibacter sp. MYC340]